MYGRKLWSVTLTSWEAEECDPLAVETHPLVSLLKDWNHHSSPPPFQRHCPPLSMQCCKGMLAKTISQNPESWEIQGKSHPPLGRYCLFNSLSDLSPGDKRVHLLLSQLDLLYGNMLVGWWDPQCIFPPPPPYIPSWGQKLSTPTINSVCKVPIPLLCHQTVCQNFFRANQKSFNDLPELLPPPSFSL